jgi:hypothetical protein
VTTATVSALRTEAGRVDLPDNLRQRMADREIARIDLATAARAAEVRQSGQAEASKKAADAAKTVDHAIARVLALIGVPVYAPTGSVHLAPERAAPLPPTDFGAIRSSQKVQIGA